ncbi:hypothetical protein AB0O32_25810 [Streptomyces rubiginosohelvolus]|uniref:hypothetical protein n=1 Tax=Streptomyces rubiginosohelvolus TaxID=67362 RepID=UPI00342A70A6
MSDDYAAIVSTLIVALLTIGTVQLVTLLKRWRAFAVDFFREAVDARRRVTLALKAGHSPAPEDFELLNILRPKRLVSRSVAALMAPYVAACVWGAACVHLVIVQIQVLRWAGADEPGPAPELAKQAFATIVVCGSAMVVEGLVRAVAGLRGTIGQRDYAAEFTAAERAAFGRSLNEYRRSADASRADSEPSTAAGVE